MCYMLLKLAPPHSQISVLAKEATCVVILESVHAQVIRWAKIFLGTVDEMQVRMGFVSTIHYGKGECMIDVLLLGR